MSSTMRVGAALCSSAQPLAQQGGSSRRTPKPVAAVPKQLGATGAAVLANGALVAAAGAEQIPFGAAPAPVALPSLSATSLPSLPAVDIPDVDVSSLLGGADPVVVAAGAAAVAVPVALALLLGGGSSGGAKAKPVPASTALEALAADERCLLLDIRSKIEIKENGSPNLKGVNKRGVVAVPYTLLNKEGEFEVDEEFGAKVAKLKGLDAGSPIILLDTTGAEAVAAAAAIKEASEELKNKFYYIQGGAEAWQASGSPWKEPSKGLSFELPDLVLPDIPNVDLKGSITSLAASVKELADDFEEAPTVAKGVLVGGAVIGAGALIFTQAELIFEVAGLLAVGQFLLRMLTADDREKTLTELKKITDKVGIDEVGEDLSKIASSLLPLEEGGTTKRTKSPAPAPAAAAAAPAAATTAVETPAPAAPVAAASVSVEAPAPAPAAAEEDPTDTQTIKKKILAATAAAAAGAAPATTPVSNTATASAADVPANVAEARKWIANWRESQGQSS